MGEEAEIYIPKEAASTQGKENYLQQEVGRT